MLANQPSSRPNVAAVLEDLARLRRFAGPPQEFWPAFLSAAARLVQAYRAVLLSKEQNSEQLKQLSDWSSNGQTDPALIDFANVLPDLAAQCLQSGQAFRTFGSGTQTRHVAVAVTVHTDANSTGPYVAAFLLLNATEVQAREAIIQLDLAADVPLAYFAFSGVQQARTNVERFASVLDLLVLVNAETRFLAASLAFCNGLAQRFQADRVSLGWLQGGYIRLKSISRTERFDRHMEAVKSIEVVMEEAFDQNEPIVWPKLEGGHNVTREHEKYSRERSAPNVASVPVTLEGNPVAVVTLERAAQPFSSAEVQEVSLACDQVARRLDELKRKDRWFGARWLHQTKSALARVLGPNHTWAKAAAIAGCIGLVILCLPIFPFRVEGTFTLRSDEVAYVTAPFDGYIEAVHVRPGDAVTNGAPMLQLHTEDLKLQEAAAAADEIRYVREAEKARANQTLGEMRIAQSLAEQARARRELTRLRLQQAAVRAPFNAVIADGDLRQRIGAPVSQGEALYTLALLEKLYVEIEVPERDVHEVLGRSRGELAFWARPELTFPVQVERIEPAAVAKSNENVFLVRGRIEGPLENWWRPGLTGICKLEVERRSILWVISRRLVDFFRMFLWW
jgi:hypothetical protein